MKRPHTSAAYKVVYSLIKFFYPKIRVVGTENLPETAFVAVGNHSQMHGPIAGELYFPVQAKTWCAGEMMHRETVPEYAFRDFWSQKPKWTHPFYKLLSHIITPLSTLIFNNAETIGVYHDARILSTFKETVACLQDGDSILIFPEHDVPHNHILAQFQDRFIDVAKLYYRRTGKRVAFVPMYLAPKLRTMYFGEPVWFDPDRPMEEERQRICSILMAEITNIACALPRHTVVPYRNIRKREYPKNK